MRIISGKFGGRKVAPVPGTKTRPTTDKVRESLFNMIGPYFDSGSFLDLFAGSGAVSIEAISRGMNHAVLVDRQYAAYKTIKKNIEITNENQKDFKVLKMDAEQALKKLSGVEKFDYIFLDPPYAKQQMVKQLAEIKKLDLLNPRGIVICETDNQTNLEEVPDYDLIKQKDYGLTVITIYRAQE
ncbi:16S rRNA (guanine(966)-N(2))-methyltransferase RsmD [Fructilactobacillus sp. Tb1]|uniref:16S rRNA (guanine(966)-N(2))-methyltransferase RsmD n=1 Tax=Fructilactobacillus sp. Tb1 TaxID=3422304 RepID=UPI003D2BA150